jgi:L-amino acid N-acyltransferase YncA
VRGDDLLGFAAWGPSRDDDAAPGLAELYAIYLEQAAVGTGVAEALMVRALREMAAQCFAEATLWVLSQNPRARRFYERLGWRLDGRTRTVDLRGSVLEAIRYRAPVL